MWKRNRSDGSHSGSMTHIDEGSEIEGKCTFSGTVMMNGKCQGEIVSTGTLIIGETGVVKANIEAATLIVRGNVEGNIRAGVRVELRGEARVVGNVETPIMIVDEGARLDGQCRMFDRAAAPPAKKSLAREPSVAPEGMKS